MKYKTKYGSWALITGASSGIGKEFALQLGKAGLNLVLVARRQDQLNAIAQLVEKTFDVQTKIVSVDLTKQNFLETIKKVTDPLDIGLLINNAGLWKMGKYMDISIENEMKMIDLNIKAPAILTHHFADIMIANGKGGIINVASMLGYLGVPYSTVYSASKAYELVKSEGLWYELKKEGIDVISLNPGITKTEMIADYDFSHMPMKPMDPQKIVRSGLSALGRKSQIVPGIMNKTLSFMSKHFMSRDMNTRLFGLLMGIANRKRSNHQ